MDTPLFKTYYTNTGKKLGIELPEDIFSRKNSIYEVIKVVYGIPMFYEEHEKRMIQSCKLNDFPIPDLSLIKTTIKELINTTGYINGNVKLIYSPQSKNPEDIFIYFIPHFYPPKELYEKGVRTVLIEKERINPQSKTVDMGYKNSVNDIINSSKAFEGLLVNRHGQITEGSRSNVFFIKDDIVYTAPDQSVLQGITRKMLLFVCNQLHQNIQFEFITKDQLTDIDAAFITGTSIDALPIREINNHQLDVNNSILKKIIIAFKQLATAYILNEKSF
ncbi:MAG: aminotransferase class IV [Bacteroidales bacterium]